MSCVSKNRRGHMTFWLALLVPLFVPAPCSAEIKDNIQIHGFLTQGFVYTTDNRFFGESDTGSFEFTEIGLNASARLMPNILLSAQLMVRNAGDMYDGTPALDFGLADWTIHSNENARAGLRLGRIKNVLGLYNETRDVASTRPSIFLPQSIYFDKVRNLELSSDGALFYGDLYRRFGTLSVQFGMGKTQVDTNVEIAYLWRDFAGHLKAKDLTTMGRIQYESANSEWHFAFSAADSKMHFNAAPTDPIGSGNVSFQLWVLSGQYQTEYWSVSAEYMQEPVKRDGFGPTLDNQDATADGWYLQATYELAPKWQLVARYQESYADRDDRDGRKAFIASGGLTPAFNQYTKDWMVGLRWDVTDNFMLRSEFQYNHGTFALSSRENPDAANLRKHWNMFSLLASYRF